jgi:DNA-binding GntR family transcriptional regulator
MTPPGTFERVYAAIKLRLREGMYRPGARLEPAALSDELNASVTPVRDALHRLTGERMVEAPRHEGFRAPLLTELMLRHLYEWHLDILLVALARRRAEREAGSAEAPGKGAANQELDAALLGVAAASGNPEHALALRNLSERLEPYRRFERHFLDGVQQETEQIVAAIRGHDRTALRRALVQYHRRRQRIVPDLLARLQEAGAADTALRG